MKNLLIVALICMLVGSIQGLTFYQHTFNTLTPNIPYYNLGYIYGGNTIMVNLTMAGPTTHDFVQGAAAFEITLYLWQSSRSYCSYNHISSSANRNGPHCYNNL